MLGSHGRALPAPGFGPAIELEALWPPGSGDRLGSRSAFIPLRLVSMASRSAILACCHSITSRSDHACLPSLILIGAGNSPFLILILSGDSQPNPLSGSTSR